MLIDPLIENIPADLRKELLAITEWLPSSTPVTYPKTKTLVHAWREFSKDSLEWSGARLVVRIDPEPYLTNPDLYQAPSIEAVSSYTTELWQPFSGSWRESGHVDLSEVAGYLKLHVGTWGKTQIARRRHTRRDRLEGMALGIHIQPRDSTATMYLLGERSLVDVVFRDLKDQIP
jgi:hypothetical protein